MFQTRTQPRELTSPASWRQTAARLADEWRVWSGSHGGVLAGQEIADLLTATREHLEREGWQPRPFQDTTAALIKVSGGDMAVWGAAEQLLELILQAQTGGHVNHDAWEWRAGRTFADVAELLRTAAQFAREYGPARPKGGA
jgi:hypothetical protein